MIDVLKGFLIPVKGFMMIMGFILTVLLIREYTKKEEKTEEA